MTTQLHRTCYPSYLRPRIKFVARVFLIAYIIGRFELGKCQELGMSESAIRAMIEEDESRGIYRLENKNEIKHFDGTKFEELKIFCHHG